jgi:hypothetical protein
MRRPAAAGGDEVAVKVHRRLGHAGGAGGEGEQARVVGGGAHGGEGRVVHAHRRFQAVIGCGVEEAQVLQGR